MNALEAEIKTLLVDALMLDAPLPDDFDPETDLFEALGLDSVDALELAMAIRRQYGVVFDAEDEANKAVFKSLRSLAAFVQKARAAGAS